MISKGIKVTATPIILDHIVELLRSRQNDLSPSDLMDALLDSGVASKSEIQRAIHRGLDKGELDLDPKLHFRVPEPDRAVA